MKASDITRSIGDPPGRRVHWCIQAKDGRRFIAKGHTAFEAAAHCGLKLSECKDNIYWVDVRTDSEV